MSYRIIHLADLHLDKSFAVDQLPSNLGSSRRAGLRATLGHILTLAREHRVDAVTIAGDLYEQDYTLPDTGDFLVQQFKKLDPIRVFIAPGESDPYTHNSLYALSHWPENVTIFSPGKISAEELSSSIYLWGTAHPSRKGTEVLNKFHVDRDGINLLLLHAVDAQKSTAQGGTSFRIDATTVRASGFDFALLGHQHNGYIWPEEAPCCAYPGSPEPLAFEEADSAHQILLLTIQDGGCVPELIPINQWHYLSLCVDLTGCDSLDEAAARVAQSLHNAQIDDEERAICYITLNGLPGFDLSITALTKHVNTNMYIRYKNELSLVYDLEQLAQEPTVRGLLVRRFQTKLNNTHDDRNYRKILNALNYALQALDGKQVCLDEIQ